jgi:hypothetical protein
MNPISFSPLLHAEQPRLTMYFLSRSAAAAPLRPRTSGLASRASAMSWVREVEYMVKVNVMTGRQLKRLNVQGKKRTEI